MDSLREFHVFHGRIRCVDLTLEFGRFLVQIRDDQSHVTENIGVNDGTNCDEACDEGYLESASGKHLITCEKEDSVVQSDKVLVRK